MRFALLGPLTVVGEAGERVSLSGPRLRTLLATLLLHANTPVSTEALAEAVWDSAPPPPAGETLRTYIRRLRQALGPRDALRIETRDPGYLIRVRPLELDVLEFEALCRDTAQALHAADWERASTAGARATALWRGEPLLNVPSQTLRDEFIPRLEQLLVQLHEDRLEADLQLGRDDQLIEQLRELTAAHPLRERFSTQLMLALARSGRQAEALEAYRDARRVLVEELGMEPGRELRELHSRILAGDDTVLAAPRARLAAQAPAPPAPAVAVPQQLPAATRYFTGRHRELAALTDLIQHTSHGSGTVVISAIDGMAGIGKTALAVHAAHQLAAKFPDGQLFLDLHGYTQGQAPRTADEALNWLLRALGVPPGGIPPDGEQAAALYRERLADTRTLIVLDNAATEAQVRPLLPGTGSCLVLVTSRRRLRALDDVHGVALDVLPASDAIVLLREVAGPGHSSADDPRLGEIAELCGYLPLALRIAASLLRHRPTWPLEHLAGQLRDQHQRLTTLSDGERKLAAVFDLSYTSLDERHRLLWRRLGLVPGPDFDAYAAAALAEIDPASAAGLLEDLVDHNLLTEYAPGRYRLHDLLRVQAHALAEADPAPESRAALDRLLNFYAYGAQTASMPIARSPRPTPNGPAPVHGPALTDPDSARAWLRTEQGNLEAAFTHAGAHGLDEHAIALAAGLAEIMQADGPFAHALRIHQAAAAVAERLGHRAAQANALANLGRIRAMTGDYPAARDALARAQQIQYATGDRLDEAGTLVDLGRVRFLTGDHPGADDATARALELYRTLGDRRGEAGALIDLGRLRFMGGDFPGAGDAYGRALEIHRALGHQPGQASALNELGRVRILSGDYAGAADAHTQALEIYRALGHRAGEANALNELARVQTLTGDYAQAEDAHTRALEIYHALGHGPGEAGTLTSIGGVRTRSGDYPGAIDAVTRALEIYRAQGDRGNEAWALNHYAAALAASGQHPRALAVYEQALAMNRELNKPDDEAISLEGIAEHHLATGDPVQGITYLREALQIFDRLGMAPDTRRVQDRLDDLTA